MRVIMVRQNKKQKMKIHIQITIGKEEKVSYGTSEVEIGKFTREIKQRIPAKELKNKTIDVFNELRAEVNEVFNREIEAEELAAKLEAEKNKAESNS